MMQCIVYQSLDLQGGESVQSCTVKMWSNLLRCCEENEQIYKTVLYCLEVLKKEEEHSSNTNWHQLGTDWHLVERDDSPGVSKHGFLTLHLFICIFLCYILPKVCKTYWISYQWIAFRFLLKALSNIPWIFRICSCKNTKKRTKTSYATSGVWNEATRGWCEPNAFASKDPLFDLEPCDPDGGQTERQKVIHISPPQLHRWAQKMNNGEGRGY